MGLNELAEKVAALQIPKVLSDKVNNVESKEFANSLHDLMIEYRDMGHDWTLTAKQELRWVNYVLATRLLEDCLELAFMPPDKKKAMLNSLYLPPAQAESEHNA
ncbi:MAG: hypothetical protein AUG51_01920 [Acidobacteria bacterium 13_1_20CM_3_53_8]|nr:MAG: hypothetical protein AUG51_01920 [Acidobacteria bacterium 13_1_20CM_3_53_8]